MRERFATGRERAVDTKSSVNDPVSEADHASERAIRDVLARLRPQDGIMGEEGDDVAGSSGLRWIVDPLDGTVNFLYGIPQWCVSVCCEDRVGVVFDPVRDELFAVVAGERTTLNGVALGDRRAPDAGLSGALVATGFGYEAAVRERQARIVRRRHPARAGRAPRR